MKKVFFIVCDMLVRILRHEILIQTFVSQFQEMPV